MCNRRYMIYNKGHMKVDNFTSLYTACVNKALLQKRCHGEKVYIHNSHLYTFIHMHIYIHVYIYIYPLLAFIELCSNGNIFYLDIFHFLQQLPLSFLKTRNFFDIPPLPRVTPRGRSDGHIQHPQFFG